MARLRDGYLWELSRVASRAVASLPARAAILEPAVASAQRAAQAQIRMHAAPRLGVEQLREWAQAHGAYHLMMLTGVVAYYTSAPEARDELARPAVGRLHAALAPLIAPTLVLMRVWRLVRRLRGAKG